MPRRYHLVAVLGLAAGVGTLVAQTAPPPKTLPASITGQVPGPVPVTPVGGNQVAAAAPIERFLKDRGAFPPETEQAIDAVRFGGDWLYRMNQPGGRFLPGLNPATRQWVESDADFRQALATLALCEAAKFTGDERYAARANGAVLALLAGTKPDADPACRVPTAANDRCNRVGYASVTALAIYALPNPDAKLLQSADALMKFVRKQVRANGAIAFNEPATDEPHAADAVGAAVYPGYALQALSASLRLRPDAETRELFPRAMAYQARLLKTHPRPMLVATTLPALVDYALLANKDPGVVGMVFDAADWLGTCQVTRADPRRAVWAGGFTSGPGATAEPTVESAACALSLCHAARLTRQVPDAARFTKYRAAAVEGLAFARNLQFTDETADHFEKAFRARHVVGGVRVSPADGTLRIDATAHLVLAHLAYLQCGTEQRLE